MSIRLPSFLRFMLTFRFLGCIILVRIPAEVKREREIIMKNNKVKPKANKKTVSIALITIVALAIATAILVSCTGFNKNEPLDVQVENALEAVLDMVVSLEENPDDLLTVTASRCEFEVLSCDDTEIGASVTILVKAPDLYTVAKEIDANQVFETDEELQNAVVEAITTAQIVEQEIMIEFRETENGYEPMLTMEFLDAYFGGVFKLLDEVLANMNEEAAQ